MGYFDWLTNPFEKAVDETVETAETAVETVEEEVIKPIEQVGEDVKEGAETLMKKIFDADPLEDFLSAFKDFTGGVESLVKMTEKIGTNRYEKINTGVNKAVDTIENIGNKSGDFIKQFIESLVKLLKDLLMLVVKLIILIISGLQKTYIFFLIKVALGIYLYVNLIGTSYTIASLFRFGNLWYLASNVVIIILIFLMDYLIKEFFISVAGVFKEDTLEKIVMKVIAESAELIEELTKQMLSVVK